MCIAAAKWGRQYPFTEKQNDLHEGRYNVALDRLAEAEAISFRTPYQSNPLLRKQINTGVTRFVDMHLSLLPQSVRYGFLGPVHWAVVEACDVTAGGGIVLTTSVGASNTFLHCAEKVIIELNSFHPPTLLGLHDLFERLDLFFDFAFMRSLVGRFDMHANQIMIRQSGDGGPALGGVVRVKVTGGARHIDSSPT